MNHIYNFDRQTSLCKSRKIENKSTTRLEYIDIGKAIGIICVVLFHAVNEGVLKTTLNQFQLPLFLVLSGMIFNKTNTVKISNVISFILKKIKSIYKPFVFWNLLFLLFHNVFCNINFIGLIDGNEYYEIADFFDKGFKIFIMGGGESLTGPLWYLITLLETTIIFAFFLFLSNTLLAKLNAKTQMFIVLFCLLFCYAYFANKDLPRHLSTTSRSLVFYSIGYYLKETKFINKNFPIKIMLPLDMMLMLIMILCTKYSESWLSSNLLIVIVSAICGIIPIIHISKLISKYINRNLKGIFVVIGKNTLGILALHLLLFCIVKTIYVFIYDLDVKIIATTGAISNFWWTPVYVFFGIIGSLLIYISIKFGINSIKNRVMNLLNF